MCEGLYGGIIRLDNKTYILLTPNYLRLKLSRYTRSLVAKIWLDLSFWKSYPSFFYGKYNKIKDLTV